MIVHMNRNLHPSPLLSQAISCLSHSNMYTCNIYLFVLQSIFLLHSLCIRFVLVQSIFHFFSFPTILVDLWTNTNTVNPSLSPWAYLFQARLMGEERLILFLSILHEELERKVVKPRQMKLEVMQSKINKYI